MASCKCGKCMWCVSPVKTGRTRAVKAVMDLVFALRAIKGQPTIKDLVKLAKRIKHG